MRELPALPRYEEAVLEPKDDLATKSAFKTSGALAPQRSSVLKWWPEAFGWVISALIVAATVVVLRAYDGVAIVQWQSSMPITLNAFLSLLVTFLYMALMVPIPKCIAQLKWNHYTTSRPLSDVEIFDEASRTVWGSAVLLATRPSRLLAALGAFLTLAVAGVGPFVQQILTQEVVPHQLDAITPTVPIFNWTSSYSGTLTMAPNPNPGEVYVDGIVDQPIDSDAFDAAFYTGLMASAPREFPVASSCTKANCTWTPYWTLVVESECHNLTDQLNRTTVPWTLPNKMEVEFETINTYNLTTNFPSLAFRDRGNLLTDFFFTASLAQAKTGWGAKGYVYTATAMECILQLRAQKLHAEYKDGQWSETRIGPSISASGIEARGCSPWRRLIAAGEFDYPSFGDATGELYPNASGEDPLLAQWFPGGNPLEPETNTCNITIPTNVSANDTGPTLIFPATQLLNPADRLIYLLGGDTGGIIGQAGGKTGGILNYLVSLVSTDPRTQSYLEDGYNITFTERMDNIAKSMTQMLRSSYFKDHILVPGVAYRDTQVYQVEWYWVIVPVSLVLLTLILLVLTIWDTFCKGLQKRTDSSLALMVFGCDEGVRHSLATAGSDLAAVTVAAKQQLVRLGADHVLALMDDGGDKTTSNERGERRRIV